MTSFSYEGRNARGEKVKGEIEANDENAAASSLMSREIIPLTIKKRRAEFSWSFSFSRRSLTAEQLNLLCQQFYSLLKAGVPILASIQQLQEITAQKFLKNILGEIANNIRLGVSLAKSMEAYPDAFPRLLVALVATGEANGRLDQAFEEAAHHYELASVTKRRIKSALRYPVTVMIVAVFALLLMNAFIVPKFAALFARFEAQLPLPTRILIATSNGLRSYGWLMLIGVVIMFFVVVRLLKQERFRYWVNRYSFKIPIIGQILYRIMMTNFTRTLAILLKTNVPLPQALRLVSSVVDNEYIRTKIVQIREDIERGESLSHAAVRAKIFSPLVLQMFSVGDTTGNLDKMLFDVSDFYEREIDFDIKQLTDKIEPILLLFVGAVVLVLALGIFLPMWNMVYVVH